MRLVIDVPQNLVCKGFERPFTEEEKNILIKAIGNGTPLPKHGRLVDADEIDNNIYDLTRSMDLNYGQISEVVDTAPTIIEADEVEE
jgi:hypothetical protein